MVKQTVADARIGSLERELQQLRLQREAQMEEMRLQGEAHMEEMRKLLTHRTRRRRDRSRPTRKSCDGEEEIGNGQATKGKETNLTLKEGPPDDGSKVTISITSAAAPEQVPHHRPTTTATPPTPSEPINGATREEEKEQESKVCHPDQRSSPKLQDNSVGWGKINSTPWVKKGSTRKKKKPSPQPVSGACDKKRKIRSTSRFLNLGRILGRMKLFKSNRIGFVFLYSQLLYKIIVKWAKSYQSGSKSHDNCSQLGSLFFQQWDPGGNAEEELCYSCNN